MIAERSTVIIVIFMIIIAALVAVVASKEDVYTRGYTDGRVSIVAEQLQEDTIILTGVTMSCTAYDADGNPVKVNCPV